jgi:hypothetical protein
MYGVRCQGAIRMVPYTEWCHMAHGVKEGLSEVSAWRPPDVMCYPC